MELSCRLGWAFGSSELWEAAPRAGSFHREKFRAWGGEWR